MESVRRVLIVEDLALAQKAAVEILTLLGYETDVANCGATALELILTQPYDMLIMDLDLPDLNGFEVSKTIRKLERKDKRRKIIALTAHSSEDLGRRCQHSGIDNYILKPLTIEKARNIFGNNL